MLLITTVPFPIVPSISRKIVQEINQSESNTDLIQLSKGELSAEIFPLAVMKEMMGKVSQHMEAFGYEEPKGYLPLREALSKTLIPMVFK